MQFSKNKTPYGVVCWLFNQLSYFSIKQTGCQILNGGDEEIRTPDPLLARQVLSQLSYAPMSGYALVSIIHSEESVIFLKLYLCLALLSVLYTMCISSNMSQLVGLGGLEPPTSRLSGVRSNQLSYRPISVDWESLQISQNRTMLGAKVST